MRVLQVLGSSAGGVARHVGQVAAVLRDAGDAVRVAGPADVLPTVRATAAGGRPAEAGPSGGPGGGARAGAAQGVDGVPVEIADRPRASDVAAVRRLRALARDADVVHAHGLRAGALAVLAVRGLRRARPSAPDAGGAVPEPGRLSRGGPRRPASRRRPPRPRVVVTLHNLPVGGRGVRAVSGVLERVVARGADVVLGVSPDLVERAGARGAREVDLALVPAPGAPHEDAVRAAHEHVSDAVARAAVRATLTVREGEALVVTVARLAPQKGLDTLLDASARTTVPLTWVVAGDGPLHDRLVTRAVEERLPVRLLGARSDVPDLLAAADLVVSAARWEGQPLWLQEALAASAAIVATDAGGTRAVVGAAARLVPVDDAVALAAAVDALLTDRAARDGLRSAAADRAAELPGPADLAAQLAAVYRGQIL